MENILALAGIEKIYVAVGIVAVLIVGVVILVKYGKWWGLLPIAGAFYWAYEAFAKQYLK